VTFDPPILGQLSFLLVSVSLARGVGRDAAAIAARVAGMLVLSTGQRATAWVGKSAAHWLPEANRYLRRLFGRLQQLLYWPSLLDGVLVSGYG
jgi:hypothetical protein